MAVRALIIVVQFALALLCASPGLACFGPKLFIGVPDDPQGQMLTSIVAIYVKEKTGIETERIEIGSHDVVSQIVAEKIDFGFTGTTTDGLAILLKVEGLPALVSGPRIPGDLQFTTVAPALERLQRVLTADHVRQALQRVAAGELPMAAARAFLMEQRWI